MENLENVNTKKNDRMNSAVIGIFTDITDARRAVDELHIEGFGQYINLIENDRAEWQQDQQADTSESRGGLGDFFSRLFGMDEETKPGVSFQSQSEKENALDSLDLGVAGRWGLDEASEKYLIDANHQGQHLLVVYSLDEEQKKVKKILQTYRGEILIANQKFSGSETPPLPAEAGDLAMRGSGGDSPDQEHITLKEEQIVARKESVKTGEVRAHKETVTEVKNIEVPFEREEVVIERRQMQGDEAVSAIGAELDSAANNDEIRIPVKEEQVHIEKKVVPREEVTISKQKLEETKHLTEKLQREEAHVESEGRVAIRNKADKKADRGRKSQQKSDQTSGHQPTP